MNRFDWTPLRAALRTCRAQGVAVPFWWRDDDAVAPTRALDQLKALSQRVGIPVHLAIIPAHMDQTLPSALDPDQQIPVVHGWAHTDHSEGRTKKNEFLTPRPDALDETQRALSLMRARFGDDLRLMFVPPWNRIAPSVSDGLAQQGYTALSTFGPRDTASAAPGLEIVNTHVDPIWWKGTRDLADPDQLIARAAAHLIARTNGDEDADEPFGLLTHHLVHTDAIWAFTEGFLNEMQNGGATPWTMKRTR